MRVIHFADLHIGVEQYGRPLPNTAWSSRMQDFLNAFDEMVEYALAERADAVIFAGDAYKAREPTQTQQREFASRIRRLSDAGIATFLLVGNHDLPNAEGRAHVLEIFRTLDVPNVSIGDNAWFRANGYRPQVLETRAGPLQVAALPWPQVSRLLANDPEVASMSIEQQLKVIQEKLTAVVTEQAQALDPGLPALLTCHVSVNDFERSIGDVAMLMGGVKTSAGLGDDVGREGRGHAHAALTLDTHEGVEALAVEVLHHEVEALALLAKLFHGDEVLMT